MSKQNIKIFYFAFYGIILSCLWSTLYISAQNWEFEEAIQLIRPKMYTRLYGFQPYSGLPNASYRVLETGTTFPIRHKLNIELQKDALNSFLNREWDKVLDVKAYVLLGALQAGVRYGAIEGDTILNIQNFFMQASMGGVHWKINKNIFFWQVQSHLFSEPGYADFPGIYSAVAGWFNPFSLRKYLYYGVALTYFRIYSVPIPFLGGQYPMHERWNLTGTLPLRLGIQYLGKGFSITSGIRPAGQVFIHHLPYRFQYLYWQMMQFHQARIKLGRGIFLWAEASWAFYGNLRIFENQYKLNQSGIYLMCGLSFMGGNTLLQKIMNQIFQ